MKKLKMKNKVKICTKCNRELFISNFIKGNDKDGLNYWCKDCFKEYYQNHKIEIIKRAKQNQQEHKEERKNYLREYRRIHRKEHNEYIRNKRKSDIKFNLGYSLRKRIWKTLKNNSKSEHTLVLVGCSLESLKKHLESQFQPGMSWNNYGKWHVDHIKPCALFDLSKPEEQRKCFNYTNLQPLWALDNLRKYKKYD